MTLQQEVVIAGWEREKKAFIAKVGEEEVEGLMAITNKLSANGWEIINVVVLDFAGSTSGVGKGSVTTSRMGANSLGIFIKRHRPDGERDG
jgi:hypothetical protein